MKIVEQPESDRYNSYTTDEIPKDVDSSPKFVRPLDVDVPKEPGKKIPVPWSTGHFGSNGKVHVRLCKGKETRQLQHSEFEAIMLVLSNQAAEIHALLEYSSSLKKSDYSELNIDPEYLDGELDIRVNFPGTYVNPAPIGVGEEFRKLNDENTSASASSNIIACGRHKGNSTLSPDEYEADGPTELTAETVRRTIHEAYLTIIEPKQIEGEEQGNADAVAKKPVVVSPS